MSQPILFPSGLDSGAVISDCGVYRYRLWRYWDQDRPRCNFLMLNPSTANEVDNDPTVSKCIRYARSWGYGGIIVSNLFALRSTDPAALGSYPDPVGPEDDDQILLAAWSCSIVVAAWGAHPGIEGRVRDVRRLLADTGISLHCLTLTKGGHPGHPLFLRGGLRPVPMEA
jgi:hypothetical protein